MPIDPLYTWVALTMTDGHRSSLRHRIVALLDQRFSRTASARTLGTGVVATAIITVTISLLHPVTAPAQITSTPAPSLRAAEVALQNVEATVEADPTPFHTAEEARSASKRLSERTRAVIELLPAPLSQTKGPEKIQMEVLLRRLAVLQEHYRRLQDMSIALGKRDSIRAEQRLTETLRMKAILEAQIEAVRTHPDRRKMIDTEKIILLRRLLEIEKAKTAEAQRRYDEALRAAP